MVDKQERVTILVVGDVMVDRTWVVTGRVQDTVQAHSAVKPNKREYPHLQADRLGGAGMTAAALAHICKESAEVHLAGLYDDIDDVIFGVIKPHRLDLRSGARPTTIKWRVYSLSAREIPTLRFRFDQDPPPERPVFSAIPSEVLDLKPNFLIISDFNKGVAQPELITDLLLSFPKATVLVDTKNSALFDMTPLLRDRCGTLFLNREEACSLWRNYTKREESPDIFDSINYCKLEVLRLGSALLERLPGWTIVVKLDKDGSFIFKEREFFQVTTKPLPSSGIAAGDFFLAGWVSALLEGKDSLKNIAERATQLAYLWTEYSESAEAWLKARLNGRESPIPSDMELDFGRVKCSVDGSAETRKVIEHERSKLFYPGCLDCTLDGKQTRLVLEKAKCGLGGFLVVDPKLRRELRSFVHAIQRYLNSAGETRPLNCLLTAQPGTGKSFLLREIATKIKTHFCEINISQCSSTNELLAQLAWIAGQGDSKRLLMLDEVDSRIDGEHVYPLLLAPLWDGKVFYDQHEWNLGKRFVTVLIASSPNFPDSLLKDQGKGADLFTRLNGPRIHLKSPGDELSDEDRDIDPQVKCKADYAYLVASVIRRYHNEINWVSREVMDTLCGICLPPRYLEYLLSRLEPQGDSWLRVKDLQDVFVREKSSQASGEEKEDKEGALISHQEHEFEAVRRKIDSARRSLKLLQSTETDEKNQRIEIIDA